ncbi:hypothetical protein ACI2L4_12365 [Streptomyces sparsogenes]|uniref:hypothetical protein n=1 Tax=Streptomyces sparsogenes TaxID=67365 RepID=UPI00384BC67F
MSMLHAIAWICEALLRLVLPPSGRHRATRSAFGRPAMRRQPPGAQGAAMARPYVVAHEQQREQRTERRLRRRRRRTLWLAVHGIDIGPRVIHGVRVVA